MLHFHSGHMTKCLTVQTFSSLDICHNLKSEQYDFVITYENLVSTSSACCTYCIIINFIPIALKLVKSCFICFMSPPSGNKKSSSEGRVLSYLSACLIVFYYLTVVKNQVAIVIKI